MLEQLLVKHSPPGQIKSAIEEVIVTAKKAAKEESTTRMHGPCEAVKSIRDSLKADILLVQNSLELKISELQNGQRKILSTADSLSKSTESLRSSTRELESKVVKVNDTTDKIANTTMSYREAILANPSSQNRSNADPKVLSGMDKKARQLLIGFDSLLDNTTRGTCLLELRNKANDIVANLDIPARPKEVLIVDVARTRDSSLLLLLDSKESADWLREMDVEDKFLDKFAPGAFFRSRKFNILLRWVPITFEPSDRKHHREIEEANKLPDHSIQSFRWIKPIIRRRAGQTRAHAVITVTSADVANLIIKEGITIHGARPKAEKTKQEPIQCLKCRGWEHKAQDCLETSDTCGTCGGNHRTNACDSKDNIYCVSCKNNDHASWDRSCPEFRRRCIIYDERHPENKMVYFPTEQDWTLTTRPDRIPLEERFPRDLAVNSHPRPTRNTSKPSERAPIGKTADTNSPQRTQPRRDSGRHMQRPNGPANSFINRTGPNLIPLGRSREKGDLSGQADRDDHCDQSDTSFIDRELDLDESSNALPGKWTC